MTFKESRVASSFVLHAAHGLAKKLPSDGVQIFSDDSYSVWGLTHAGVEYTWLSDIEKIYKWQKQQGEDEE